MSLPGGPADKLGNRYERFWTSYQLLYLIDGRIESIRLEEPGVDEAEFVVSRGNRRDFHQVKRGGIRASWSVASLAAAEVGVLQSIRGLLENQDASFVFVSDCAAGELAELCEAARSAESEQEFLGKFLAAARRRGPFDRIRREWACDSKTAIEHLRRVEVHTISERDLEEAVRHYGRTLFLDDETKVVAELLRVVDRSLHKTIHREDLVDLLRGSGFVQRRVTSPEQAVEAVREATDSYLGAARRRLIHQELVPRAAAQTVQNAIGNSATALVGKAGSGKTACAVEIVEGVRSQGSQVMAFRLDRHVSASNTGDLGDKLGLQESPALMLAAAAKASGSSAVLLVDQLDAVSIMSGRNSEALDLVEDLLVEASALRGQVDLHVVVVCRSFDWDNDDRLRRLIRDGDACVAVDEFTDDETRELLQRGGFSPSLFRDRQLRLLRTPQSLSLFLNAGFDTESTLAFDTVTELFDRYWDAKRRLVAKRAGHSIDHWEQALRLLCSEMTAKQELSVRREVLDSVHPLYLKQMASEGVLALEHRRYGFGHESFFDYCYARALFLPGSASLTSMLLVSEQHLFRRGQVRQVLTYVRDAEFDRYLGEVRALLSEPGIRVHVKDLVLALLADVPDPREEEWRIWSEWTESALKALETKLPNEDKLSELAWRRLYGSESWFEFLVSRGVVERWLNSGNDQLTNMAVQRYLCIHQRHAPDTVAKLLEPYAESGGDWSRRLEQFTMLADPSGSRRMFDLFLRLVDNGTLDSAKGPFAANSTFWNLFPELETKRPEWVGEVLAHRIRRRLAIVKERGELRGNLDLLGYDHGAAAMFFAAAAAAPLAFVEHVLPVVLEISDFAARIGKSPRRDAVWAYRIKTEYPSADDACLESLTQSVEKLAGMASMEQCGAVLAKLRVRDTDVANNLLLALCRGAPERFADEMATGFSVEPWRFDCGYSDNPRWCAMETISAVVSHCTRESLGVLENAILDYVPEREARVDGRSWRGEAQFALLSAIPMEIRSERAHRRFQELERKFGEPPGEPKEMKARIVGPPIAPSESEKMTDDQWLKAVKRYSAEERWDGDGHMVGGAFQLSQVLEECVKKEPDRYARLAMKFDPGMNPAYMQRTLAGLGQVDADDGLKLGVCLKAFAESREACGAEIADVIGSISGALPDDVVKVIDWLATQHPDPERELWQEDAPGGLKYHNGDVHGYGINTARGRAAIAIQRLILSDSANLRRFRGTLDRMVEDRSSAVLSCVAGIFEAVAATDPVEAVALFLTMKVPTDELLATPRVIRFMRYSLAKSFTELRPLIVRMICSSQRAVATKGATLAGLALLHGHHAESLVRASLSGGDAQRFGIAKVASSNIKIRDCREWCERTLMQLFNDKAPEVRREAASCFRYLEGEPLEDYRDLVNGFSVSKAFGDDSSSILGALEDSRQRLPGMTCLVCERHLSRFSEEASDLQSARASDLRTLVKLVFRTYQQHQRDEWASRALDLIDRLCLEGMSGTVDQLDRFER